MSLATIGSANLNNPILTGSLFASALVILKPFEFGLKRYLHWKHGYWLELESKEFLNELKTRKNAKLQDKQSNFRGFFFNIVSSPYFAQTRSIIIGAINLVLIIFIIMFTLINQSTTCYSNLTPIILGVSLISLIVIMIKREIQRTNDKLLLVTKYYCLVKYTTTNPNEISSFRKALEEGNWEEASSWLQYIIDH